MSRGILWQPVHVALLEDGRGCGFNGASSQGATRQPRPSPVAAVTQGSLPARMPAARSRGVGAETAVGRGRVWFTGQVVWGSAQVQPGSGLAVQRNPGSPVHTRARTSRPRAGPASSAPPALGGMVWTLTHRTRGWGWSSPAWQEAAGRWLCGLEELPVPPPPAASSLPTPRPWSASRVPIKGTGDACGHMSPCNWSPSTFLKSSLKAFGRYLCPWGHCREDRPLKSGLRVPGAGGQARAARR